MSKTIENDLFEKMGNKVPGAFTTLAMGFGIYLIISITLLIIIFLLGLIGASFSVGLNLLTFKFTAVLLICLILSAIPIGGIYIVLTILIKNVPELILAMSIEINVWIWIIYIICFFIGIGVYLFNTISQFYVIFIVDYPTLQLKRKNQIYSILILICSALIGVIIGINFDMIFLSISTFIFNI